MTLTVTPEPWMAIAACRGCDPELWFSVKPADIARAKAVCATCVVAAECLQMAVDEVILHGVFGGLSPKERRPGRLRASRGGGRPREDIPCGTDAGYRAHLRRGTDPCPECRAAHSTYVLANDRRRRLRVVGNVVDFGGAA